CLTLHHRSRAEPREKARCRRREARPRPSPSGRLLLTPDHRGVAGSTKNYHIKRHRLVTLLAVAIAASVIGAATAPRADSRLRCRDGSSANGLRDRCASHGGVLATSRKAYLKARLDSLRGRR